MKGEQNIKDLFFESDKHGRAVLIQEHGEYVSTRQYYSMAVNLYLMPGFMAELFYSPYLNRIMRIELLTDDNKLERHLEQIDISDISVNH
ncbi:MAG: hypothetical protein IM618_14430 [Cytophagales bacterium]|jgi:hypothetical protein|nr:hypothetical protein [Cytophagales bacterium]